MISVEEILSGPDRVHCIPYQANLSREACLMQQEVARRRHNSWLASWDWYYARIPCLSCKTGKAIRLQGGEAAPPAPVEPIKTKTKESSGPRPLSCRFHPDRPRHRNLLVCLPCYRSLSRRLNRAKQGMTKATPKAKQIYRETIRGLERQIGLS